MDKKTIKNYYKDFKNLKEKGFSANVFTIMIFKRKFSFINKAIFSCHLTREYLCIEMNCLINLNLVYVMIH